MADLERDPFVAWAIKELERPLRPEHATPEALRRRFDALTENATKVVEQQIQEGVGRYAEEET